MKFKRVFLAVLDSLGAGAAPDAAEYGDEGSGTIDALLESGFIDCPNLRKAGLFSVDTLANRVSGDKTCGCFASLMEKSKGKDTTTGHWELAGVVSERPFPTYPHGFPLPLLEEFSRLTGRGWLCNMPYSGTEVIKDYGARHMETGGYIVYTSADSVFQVAAHEAVVPRDILYRDCLAARRLLCGENAVGRVIARPFAGEPGSFYRTAGRHDYSLEPTGVTMLDTIYGAGMSVISVGKINDIFAGRSVSESYPTSGNDEGISRLKELEKKDFNGLCFVQSGGFRYAVRAQERYKGICGRAEPVRRSAPRDPFAARRGRYAYHNGRPRLRPRHREHGPFARICAAACFGRQDKKQYRPRDHRRL